MEALLFPRNEARYVAAMAASRIKPGAGASFGPLWLTELDPPDLPGPGWEHVTTRLAGICGSDLATIDGRASRYFEALASFPFVPGHEVVAERADGTRVVLEPVLGPETRGEVPAWPGAAQVRGRAGLRAPDRRSRAENGGRRTRSAAASEAAATATARPNRPPARWRRLGFGRTARATAALQCTWMEVDRASRRNMLELL